jgi:PAS domain S-box-containing protein
MCELIKVAPTLLKFAVWHGALLATAAPFLAVAAKEAKANGRKRASSSKHNPASQSLKVDSEERFRALFDQASVGVALESMEGEIYHVNPAFTRMLGYSEEQLRTMRCSEFSHPDDEIIEMALFNELREGRRNSYQVDKRFRNKLGEWVWARVSVSLLKTEAETPLVVGFVEDIRERRQAEEQLKATKFELEQLAGRLLSAQEQERRRISRELHDDIGQRMSMVTSEIGKIELELRSKRKTDFAERAAALKNQLSDLASTIHDMCSNLHSSKLEHLGLRAALKDLGAVIFEHSGVSVRVEVDEYADHLQEEVALCFYRVAQEALNNVSKHSRAQTAEVVAKREDGYIRLTIQDCGSGFEPSTQNCSGGIGLASMRERLRAINGSLVVKTAVGRGTEVIAKVKYVPKHAS